MPKSKETTVRRNLSIPVSVIAPVEEIYYDVVRGKPSYGGLSELVTNLLKKHLEEIGVHNAAEAADYRNRKKRAEAAAAREAEAIRLAAIPKRPGEAVQPLPPTTGAL